MNNQDILVSIICDTFNHLPYISRCLDSLLEQKTNFLFEILVHDDCSKDGTADIVRAYADKYPLVVKPILQTENQYSKGVPIWCTYQFSRVQGKYVAFCEGDDYWVDPYKLQKQVDFLEANPDYSLIYGNIKHYIQKQDLFVDQDWIYGDASQEDLLIKGNTIPTLTCCFRFNKSIVNEYYFHISNNKHWLTGDLPLWIIVAQGGKCKFIDQQLGVYRVLEKSASHSDDERRETMFNLSGYEIRCYFMDYLKYDPELKRTMLIPMLNSLSFRSLLINSEFAKREIRGMMKDCSLRAALVLTNLTLASHFPQLTRRFYYFFKKIKRV